MSAEAKPRVLILGAAGFVGRNLLTFLIKNNLCSSVAFSDYQLYRTAFLTPEQSKYFEKRDRYIPADLAKADFLEKRVFEKDDQYDIVFNCAALTKPSQTEEDYERNIFTLSTEVAKMCVKRGVKRLIEMSDAAVYAAGPKASKEDGKIDPWTTVALYKRRVEEELATIEGFSSLFSLVSSCPVFFSLLSPQY
jgi:nucleoside-diphosphate-sugar epimerase